jgi:hypothetical protein
VSRVGITVEGGLLAADLVERIAAGDEGVKGQQAKDFEIEAGRLSPEIQAAFSDAVFIHRLGEIRDRTYENQQHRASGLNLLVAAIILWNTRYLNRAIAALREVEEVPDHLLAHLSPLGWEHVNLTGDYIWSPADQTTVNADGYRPLRIAHKAALPAA